MSIKKFIWALLLTISLITTTASSKDIYSKNGHPVSTELFRFESTDAGPMIWVRDLGSKLNKPITVDLTLKITKPWAGSHLALIVGDLYSALERSDAGDANPGGAEGEGLVIGDFYSNTPQCNSNKNNLMFESYYTGDILDKESCFPLNIGETYRIVYTVDSEYDSVYDLYDAAGSLLASKKRSWTAQHKLHNRGFFIIPITSSPEYKLISLQIIQK